MKIELILDEHCFSVNVLNDMKNRLADDFEGVEIFTSVFETIGGQLPNRAIRVLPAWLVNDEVLSINPLNYSELKQKIRERI
jgi:hypothetical protein